MPIYTQRHQIIDYIKRQNWQKDRLESMIANCKAGEQARAVENEDTFDAAAFDQWAADTLWRQSNKDVGQYIYSRYDSGTQASLLSLHNDSATPAADKEAIESVWAWIKSVMAYYYIIKAQLLNGDVVKWDFSQFNATDPDVQLGDLVAA